MCLKCSDSGRSHAESKNCYCIPEPRLGDFSVDADRLEVFKICQKAVPGECVGELLNLWGPARRTLKTRKIYGQQRYDDYMSLFVQLSSLG